MVSLTLGFPSSGTFGLFLAPGGLPLGCPVYPLPLLTGGSSSMDSETREELCAEESCEDKGRVDIMDV